MSCVKIAVKVGEQTLRKWFKSQRTWMIFIINVLLVSNYVGAIYEVADITGYAVTPWIFPFIDSQIYIRILIYAGVILLFCDAPFIDSNQLYVIYRCGRKKYAVGQIFAIMIMNMIYFLVLMIGPVLLHINQTGFSLEWGDVIRSASGTNIIEVYTGSHMLVPNVIVKYMSPIKAMLVAYVFHVMTGVLLGCVVFLGNVISKVSGILISGILVLIDPILMFYDNWYKLSPVTWGRLSMFDYIGNSKRFSAENSAVIIIIVIILIAVLCVVKCSKDEISDWKA